MLPKFWLSRSPSTSTSAIRAHGAGDLPGRTTVAIISPGSTAEGIFTSKAPLSVALATTFALASPRNVAATGKACPQPASPINPDTSQVKQASRPDSLPISPQPSIMAPRLPPLDRSGPPEFVPADRQSSEVFFTIDPIADKLVLNIITFGRTSLPMLTSTILLAGFLVGQTQIEPAHAQNSVYSQILDTGLETGGQKLGLPKPRLVDGQDADAQRAALRQVAGSDRALDDLLRDSVSAPYIIKVHDVKTSGATIRVADVWF